VYKSHNTTYSDFNRVTQSLRQPGSAMKPVVYLAAFRQGNLNLDTSVPDEPISVVVAENRPPKWISNFDNQFEGLMPALQALAESRNAVAVWIAEQASRSHDGCMLHKKAKKEPGTATRASVKREMSKPRMTKSARIAELKLNPPRIPERPSTTMPETVSLFSRPSPVNTGSH
jgi:membrane peptidoglycan carboxypeptidase